MWLLIVCLSRHKRLFYIWLQFLSSKICEKWKTGKILQWSIFFISLGILVASFFLKIIIYQKMVIFYTYIIFFFFWITINDSEKKLTSSIALWRWRCKLRALSCCFWACWKISAGKPGRGGKLGRLTGGAAPNIFSKAIRVCSSEEWGSCPKPLLGDWEAVK